MNASRSYEEFLAQTRQPAPMPDRELIQVGDVVTQSDNEPLRVTQVQHGLYGLFVAGQFLNYPYQTFEGYCPSELPPPAQATRPWRCFSSYHWLVKVNGHRLGLVGLAAPDAVTLADYEAAWERSMKPLTAEAQP